MSEAEEPQVSFDDDGHQRKVSWAKLRRVDSLNMEAGNISAKPNHHASKEVSWQRTLNLAFQCVGVIYGDIGTSSTFTDGIKHKEDILGMLSLITPGIGVNNLFKHDVGVLKAFNPKYIVDYFKRNGKQGWVSLGGVVLCITGTEAMFVDLRHFNVPAVKNLLFSSRRMTDSIGEDRAKGNIVT